MPKRSRWRQNGSSASVEMVRPDRPHRLHHAAHGGEDPGCPEPGAEIVEGARAAVEAKDHAGGAPVAVHGHAEPAIRGQRVGQTRAHRQGQELLGLIVTVREGQLAHAHRQGQPADRRVPDLGRQGASPARSLARRLGGVDRLVRGGVAQRAARQFEAAAQGEPYRPGVDRRPRITRIAGAERQVGACVGQRRDLGQPGRCQAPPGRLAVPGAGGVRRQRPGGPGGDPERANQERCLRHPHHGCPQVKTTVTGSAPGVGVRTP